jgi:hypothetical protein
VLRIVKVLICREKNIKTTKAQRALSSNLLATGSLLLVTGRWLLALGY